MNAEGRDTSKPVSATYGAAGGDSVLRYYLDVLRRRIWVISAVLLISVTIGSVNAFRAAKVYRAVAKILVERQAPRLMKFEGLTDDSRGWDPDFYKTQVELIASRAVLEKAFELLGASEPSGKTMAVAIPMSFLGEIKRTLLAALGASPAPLSEPWERLRGQIMADYVPDTHFITIKADSTDPLYAARLVNAASAGFEQYYLSRKSEMYGDAFAFLQKEKDKEEGELLKAETALQKFREGAKSVTLTGSEQEQPVIVRLNELNRELTETQLQRIDAQAHLNVVRDTVKEGSELSPEKEKWLFTVPAVRDDPAIQAAQSKVAEAEKDRATLSETYGPDHPLMKAAQEKVALLKRGFTEGLQQAILSLVNQGKTLQGKEEELAREYEEQKGRALELAKDSFEFARFQNEVERHRKLLDVLMNRMREVDVNSGFLATNVQIVEPASVPKTPYRPRRLRTLLQSVFFGLFVGFGLAFFFEHLDDTIKTPEDVRERLQAPLLGFVPKMELPEGEKGGKTTSVGGVVTLKEPISSMAEAYRNIRTSLFFSRPVGGPKVLAVTSCGPGEGKTTTATNLAVSIAQSGKRVLLVDADFHRPKVAETLSLDNSKGLTTVLIGDCEFRDAVQHLVYEGTIVNNLDVLTAGHQTSNPAELLGSKRMAALIAGAWQIYDWVLVDTPPILFVSDASILSALCEGVILVVRSGMSNRSMLNRTREHLEDINVKIIGTVLNQMVVGRFGRYYSNYYYHGYSRYSKDYHRSYYPAKQDEEKKPEKAGKGSDVPTTLQNETGKRRRRRRKRDRTRPDVG